MTRSGNPTYKIILDNRTIDTKPDAAVNYFISDSMLDKEYAFVLENGVVIDYRPMPFAPMIAKSPVAALSAPLVNGRTQPASP